MTMARAHDDAMSDDPPVSPDARPGGTSPARTSLRSSRSTGERTNPALRARSCGAKARTAPTSSSGGEPAKPEPLPHLRPRCVNRAGARRTSSFERFRRRAERAEAELARARLVIEIQGKASALLEALLAESDDPKQPP